MQIWYYYKSETQNKGKFYDICTLHNEHSDTRSDLSLIDGAVCPSKLSV